MVKLVTESNVESNAFKNNMRLDYIEGLLDACNELSDVDFECDSVTAAIQKVYKAAFELEDALAKISRNK